RFLEIAQAIRSRLLNLLVRRLPRIAKNKLPRPKQILARLSLVRVGWILIRGDQIAIVIDATNPWLRDAISKSKMLMPRQRPGQCLAMLLEHDVHTARHPHFLRTGVPIRLWKLECKDRFLEPFNLAEKIGLAIAIHNQH